MKKFVVKEVTPFKGSRIIWGGTYEECDKFCEKQDHYHNPFGTGPINTFWKPQGGYFRIIEIGA